MRPNDIWSLNCASLDKVGPRSVSATPENVPQEVLHETLTLFAAVVTAQASSIVELTFEGLGDQAQALNYYAGGFDSQGNGPGPNYGITFGSDSLSVISGCCGGSGGFSGAPTMPTILYFTSGPGDIMDVPEGFTIALFFYYSAPISPGAVTVWSGLDGTGTMLASLDLPTTPLGGPPECTYGKYCPWVPMGIGFSGTAMSANFGGSANKIGFDNITLVPSPEPGTLVMFGSGIFGLAGLLRRKFNL